VSGSPNRDEAHALQCRYLPDRAGKARQKLLRKEMLRRLCAMSAIAGALDDLPRAERLKRFPPFLGVKHALKRTLHFDADISRAADQTGVQKSAVQAVVFRETLGYGAEDLLLDRIRVNASRGLCQIRPSTAMEADKALGIVPPVYKAYARQLNHARVSILSCAKILKAEAVKIHAQPSEMTDEELLTVFKRYNGGAHYARCVLLYCRAFEMAEKKPAE